MGGPNSSGAPGGVSVRLLTIEQLSDMLQVKTRTIYQWVHEEYIPVVKLGSCVRFREDSINDWIKKRERAGRSERHAFRGGAPDSIPKVLHDAARRESPDPSGRSVPESPQCRCRTYRAARRTTPTDSRSSSRRKRVDFLDAVGGP